MANQNLALKEQIDSVRAVLEKMKPQMALALPAHVTPERLLRVTMTCVQNTPRLLECDRTSLFAAVMTAAQLGLEPDGVLGQAYLVPFNRKVQFIPGYKGLITLARNSGDVVTLQAHEVCEGDDFTYAYGLKEELHHVVKAEARTWGKITHFYAYATFKDGGHIFEVMSRTAVEAIRDNSDGYKAFKAKKIKSNPWDPEGPAAVQMGRKTVIRRIANYLPLSVQRAAAMDAAYDAGKPSSVDKYGDVVIDGEATDVTDQEGNTENAATSKLDALAGPATEEEQPQAEAKPKSKAKSNKGSAKSQKKEKQEAQADDGAITRGEVTAQIMRATTVEQIDEALDLARGLSEADQTMVNQAAESKKRSLDGNNLFGDED